MRMVGRALSFLGLAALSGAASVHAISCSNTADDCTLNGTLCPGQSTGSTSSGGGSEPDAGDPICDQSPRDNPAAVADACGVFVKAGAKIGGDGSMASPLPTLNTGIGAAVAQKKKRVYVCLGSFTELLKVPAGVTLFGGLDCAKDWSVTETKTTLKGAPDKIPLTLEAGSETTRIENFAVVAPDAAQPGGSSIAAVALEGAKVAFESCELSAGSGQKGNDGANADSMAPATPAKSTPGVMACTSAIKNAGGSFTEANTCVPPEDPAVDEFSVGGNGGDGAPSFATMGSPGFSQPETAVLEGVGGKTGVSCGAGGDGGNGSVGNDGMPGSGGVGNGTLAADGSWTGAAGRDGTKGTPGQGGGGGAGQKGKAGCAGASGGAGGNGGCGGFGGRGGGAGGSSIALVSRSATITMVNVLLKAGKGGAGGAGGSSQPGGPGGAGGDGGAADGANTVPAGCKGGVGGTGGAGGPGGGGTGGHSLGIAFVGAAPMTDPKVTFEVAADAGGQGGPGGNGNVQSNAGAAGAAQNTLEFPAP